MRLAITVWNNRIAPVFDSALSLRVLECSDSVLSDERHIPLHSLGLEERAQLLETEGIDELICGAISNQAAEAVRSRGITIHAFIAGCVPAVLQALAEGHLHDGRFFMPGCLCQRRRQGRAINRLSGGIV